MRRRLIGSGVGLVASVVLALAMLPLRDHLDSATAALVLVVPVLAGVMAGGFVSGLVSVAAGFLAYDCFFIKPYGTLTVGQAQNWVALGVYAVVMVLMTRAVAGLDEAREASEAREGNARHLLDLSEVLLVDKPAPEIGALIVDWAHRRLGVDGAALLVANDDKLEVVATAGTPLSPEELKQLGPSSKLPVHLTTGTSQSGVQLLALTTSGRPVGLLVLHNVPPGAIVREVLPILANHLAIALERAQLGELARRAELLEAVDNLRRSLIGAVSHDLRTPLAAIKVASSTFLDPTGTPSREDAEELHALIDMQADRLTRLVNSLLDMTRIQSGALEVSARPMPLADLVAEAIAGLGSSLAGRQVNVALPDGLPLVLVDPVLIVQVLANLIDNANRFGPSGTAVTVTAAMNGSRAEVTVADAGPGVPASERQAVFDKFVRFDSGGRSGLGLAIAKAFVEAHQERIWVGQAPEGGARFIFSLMTVGVAAEQSA